jgi:hypothetical protein
MTDVRIRGPACPRRCQRLASVMLARGSCPTPGVDNNEESWPDTDKTPATLLDDLAGMGPGAPARGGYGVADGAMIFNAGMNALIGREAMPVRPTIVSTSSRSSVHSKGLTESWVIAKPAGTPMIRILGTYDDGT